jgi:LCP family protein required for cell wall assembly
MIPTGETPMPDEPVPPARDASSSDALADGTGARNGSAAAMGKRRGKAQTRHTVARVLGVTVLVVAMVTGLTVVYLFRHLSGNLNELDIADKLTDRPEKVEVAGPQEPLNILVMGSDTREGEGNAIDQEAGAAASDTTILFHLSADRKRAYGISIPRDSMVDRPACENGAIPAEDDVMWNEAFTVGGPACTMQQFEDLTDIRLDHFVVVDFNGFKDMVNAIGGVEVCIPETIDDRAHGIYLEAGTREIRDKEALAYVRQRYAVGNGSDIGRMKRQQAFIASMANKVLTARTLADPVRLVKFLDAATQSLTVDPGLTNLGKLGDLGFQFRGIGLDQVEFITIPWEVDPTDPNRVVWAPEAEKVWKRIANDRPLTEDLTVDAISAAKPRNGEGQSDGADPSGSGSPSGSPSPRPDAEQAAIDAGLC